MGDTASATIAINKKIKMPAHHANNSQEAEEITTNLLKEKPDTVFCMSDEILIGQ